MSRLEVNSVYEGFVLSHFTKSLDIAGRDITRELPKNYQEIQVEVCETDVHRHCEELIKNSEEIQGEA